MSSALVELAGTRYDLFTSDTGEPFAIARGEHVARPLRGGRQSLRAELAAAFVRQEGQVPSSNALADALNVLEGRAQQNGVRAVHIRVARHEDSIVLDLANRGDDVVVIQDGNWSLSTSSPVLFRRTEATAALPIPTRGGDLRRLRDLLNVSGEQFDLLVGFLASAFIPDIPHPLLLMRGIQGSAKSTSAKFIARVIDPSAAQLRRAPRNEDAWVVAAAGSWMVALDNISSIDPWLSDALCRSSTGDGDVRRRLYTDNSLVVLAFQRVVVLTGIDVPALRGDLADRILALELEPISEEKRRLDRELAAAFAARHAGLLGALLDLLARVLEELPRLTMTRYPRMADFGRILAAVDRVRGTSALATYTGQSGRLAGEVVASDMVAQAVCAYLDEHAGLWSGTVKGLWVASTTERPPKGWPATPRALLGGAAARPSGAPGRRREGRIHRPQRAWEHPEHQPHRPRDPPCGGGRGRSRPS
jgi:hypothetical protein